jgi:hypothetical protein
VHTDQLGSLNVITSESGNIEQEMSFDAWGNRRDPNTNCENYKFTFVLSGNTIDRLAAPNI